MLEQKYLTDLDRLEIKPSDNINKDQALMCFKSNYGWAEVFTVGNISTIIGKAKGRKTFSITLLIVGMITNREPQFKSQINGSIVLFDTEQGKYHIWKLTKRIEQMVGYWPNNLKIYGLRPLSTAERLNAIESYIYQYEPQMVFIDGIRDLVTDINDAEQATDVVGKLMKWSYEKGCHINNVLHQNKADENARGHIGTEIVNKSETVLSVNKTGKSSQLSVVRSIYTRGIESQDFEFSIDNGIPVINYNYLEPYNYEPDKDEEPF